MSSEFDKNQEGLKIIAELPLTNFDTDQALAVVWEALDSYRENCLPIRQTTTDEWRTTIEVDDYAEEWGEITTAMAWITEALQK